MILHIPFKNIGVKQMSYKEKPQILHAAVQVALALIIAALTMSAYTWNFIAYTTAEALKTAGIKTAYISDLFLLYVRLLDGRVVGFRVLLECSGLITLIIFTFISALTIGLFSGSLKVKLAWFIMSIIVCFSWNIFRLISVIAVAYSFGYSAFEVIHYILAPTMDFICILSLWSVGLSWTRRRTEA